MDQQLHLAAQYLAAAGISFLDAREDDSHTNLGFSTSEESLFTRDLGPDGDTLYLNYRDFSLIWDNFDRSIVFPLEGRTHEEVVEWIRQQAKMSDIRNPYSYKFHYELPYAMDIKKPFELTNPDRLTHLSELRAVAQTALEQFMDEQNLRSDVRIWPHHFDTGALSTIPGLSGATVGMGMAIPDTVCDDHYYYLAVYRGHDPIDTSSFGALRQGEWVQEGFVGAVMPASGKYKNEVQDFLLTALHSYLSPYG